VTAGGPLPLIEHTALRDLIASWSTMPHREQLGWSAKGAGAVIHDAVLPALARDGAVRVRLLDQPDRWSLPVLRRLVVAISEQLGFLVPQTFKNNVVGLIRDAGADYQSPATRGHQTNAALSFHSDRCDLNVLFYVKLAAEGGRLRVVSYAEASERVREQNGAALATLFQPFPYDSRDERIFASPAWHLRPVLWERGNGLRGHYIRRFIIDSQRHADCPRLTAVQVDALDAFDAALAGIQDAKAFSPVAGELLVLDNYRVMHSRTEFRDVSADQGRLAIRTWVAPFHSELLPEFLLPISGALTAGSFRGGVGRGRRYHSRLGKVQP